MIAKHTDFEAAAAEIGDTAQRRFRAERGENRFPAEAGFFAGTDDLKTNFGFLQDAANEGVAVFCFAGSASGDGAIARDTELFHHFLEMAECFDSLFENLFAETLPHKNAFAEAKRITFVMKRLEIDGGMRTGNGKTDCIGTGVNRGNVNRL